MAVASTRSDTTVLKASFLNLDMRGPPFGWESALVRVGSPTVTSAMRGIAALQGGTLDQGSRPVEGLHGGKPRHCHWIDGSLVLPWISLRLQTDGVSQVVPPLPFVPHARAFDLMDWAAAHGA